MNVGLYFGSFNPIHIGHLIIANYILGESEVEKIWFVVSPLNPFKTDNALLDGRARLLLVRKAIENDERMVASHVEFELSKPSFTINTLDYLKENYPGSRFSIIMGSDSFQNLHLWKDYEAIVRRYKILIYPRPGYEIANKINAEVAILNAPVLGISSTEIRKLIKQGKSIRYLVPEKVREEIEKNQFYKK